MLLAVDILFRFLYYPCKPEQTLMRLITFHAICPFEPDAHFSPVFSISLSYILDQVFLYLQMVLLESFRR